MNKGGVTPYPLAMVVCDAVCRDSAGKLTLVGTFGLIAATDFPAKHPAFTIYVSLTDGHGIVRLRVQLVDTDEQREPVFEIDGEVSFEDPRAVHEICFEIKNIVIPAPGEYRLKLFANNEFLIERRIVVVGPNDAHEQRESDEP